MYFIHVYVSFISLMYVLLASMWLAVRTSAFLLILYKNIINIYVHSINVFDFFMVENLVGETLANYARLTCTAKAFINKYILNVILWPLSL